MTANEPPTQRRGSPDVLWRGRWPARGTKVRVVPEEDAGHRAYRLQVASTDEPIRAGLYVSREIATLFATKFGWRVVE